MSERDESTRELTHDQALSGLYRQGSPGEPSAALDATILAAARQAVQHVPVRPQAWWKRLRAPMALAATVMLAVMLSLTVERQPAELPPPVLDEQAPAPVERREAVMPQSAPVGKSDAPLAKAKKSAAPAAIKEEALTAPATAPPPMESKARQVAPAAAPAPATRDALPEQANTAASGSVAPARERVNEAKMADEAKREMYKSAPAASLRAAKPAMLAPQAWVEEIRQLRQQGRFEDAARRLAELRQAYPDFPLPEDLRQ